MELCDELKISLGGRARSRKSLAEALVARSIR